MNYTEKYKIPGHERADCSIVEEDGILCLISCGKEVAHNIIGDSDIVIYNKYPRKTQTHIRWFVEYIRAAYRPKWLHFYMEWVERYADTWR